MYTSVLQYLEVTAQKYPQKIAYEDKKESFTFDNLLIAAKKIGSALSLMVDVQQPIVVYMKKGADNIAAFMGAVYAGCFYVPIDSDMPMDRINLIMGCLHPSIVICDETTVNKAQDFSGDIPYMLYQEAVSHDIDEIKLNAIRGNSCITDLLYVLFTSGSTGIPKGVTLTHAAVIDFVEWICNSYSLTEKTTLCNQAPFYFDASVPDIYIPFKTGATVYIPPKSYYTFPKKILQFISKKNINTLFWVPSALCNVVNCQAFEVCVPSCVQLVVFCGEVMPCKHLNVWKKYLRDTKYVNMYGPTEATYACMYYNVEREFSDEDKLPLGRACENCKIILLDEKDEIVNTGEVGEICILGQCLAQGYYNCLEKTKQVFVQNPVNKNWIELMYRTGDLAAVNDNGEMVFVGRKDSQIKRLGHRIELGEIENAILSMDAVKASCCVFNEEKSEIIALYAGGKEEDEVLDCLSAKLPHYMMPSQIVRLKEMPMNINGKIDRMKLKQEFVKG